MSTRRVNSAGGIIVFHDTVLLVHQTGTDSWSFPKGHIETGESPLEAAIREIREETGLVDLQAICELGAYERPTRQSSGIRKCISMFLFFSPTDQVNPRNPEISSCRWVGLAQAKDELTYPQDGEFLQRRLHEIARSRSAAHYQEGSQSRVSV